jgi:hypothetical protein
VPSAQPRWGQEQEQQGEIWSAVAASYQVSMRCASPAPLFERGFRQEHRQFHAGKPSGRCSAISAGPRLGAARLDPHRFSRHLREARTLSAVRGGITAGRGGAWGRELSGESLRPPHGRLTLLPPGLPRRGRSERIVCARLSS